MDSRKELAIRVRHDFGLHKPNERQQVVMDSIRQAYTNLALELTSNLPLGRDLSMALTDLETSQRCAIAAVAKNQEHYT